MKKTLFFTFAALAAVCACNKENQPVNPVPAPEPDPLPKELTITAGTETKTSLGPSNVVVWQQDTLVVFDSDLTGVKFSTTQKDVPTAEFTTTSWTGKVPEYAASYFPEFNVPFETVALSKGVMPVEIRPVQAIGWTNTFGKQSFASVGKVVENDGTFTIAQMKNVMGLIGVKFSDPAIKKIVATAIGGEQMTGWVSVDYEKLAAGNAGFWAPIDGKKTSSTATITVTKIGQYYISVLPQVYAQGIRLEAFNAANEVVAEHTIGATSGIEIKRSEISPLAKDIDYIPLPETVVLDLVFNNTVCPLGTFKPVAEQVPTGDSYTFTYNYTIGGKDYSKDFEFKIGNKQTSGYSFRANTGLPYANEGMLVTGDKNIWMAVPGIEGKYLSTICVKMGNAYTSADRLVRVKTSPSASSLTQMKPAVSTASGPVATYIHFYTNGNDGVTASLQGNVTEKGTAYYLIFADTFNIDTITLTYTDELPAR